MDEEYNVKGVAGKIKVLRKNAVELKSLSGGIQAVDRNVDRILANIKVLEISVTDAAGLNPRSIK